MQKNSSCYKDNLKDDIASQRFSLSLRRFHERLFSWRWEEQFPGLVFIRDYEGLPSSAPSYVGIMSPPGIWFNLADAFFTLAKELDLVVTNHRCAHSLAIVVLDPVVASGQQERTWVCFEVHDEIVINPALTITSDDLDLDNDSRIPVPNDFWKFCLTLVQCAKKNDLKTKQPYLRNLAKRDPDVFRKTAELLGVKGNEVEEGLCIEMSPDTMRERLGIVANPCEIHIQSSWKSSLTQYIEERLFFIHFSNPFLYTLHGADGVGKTTLGREVRKIFEGFPIPFETFHHVTSWKHPSKKMTDQGILRRDKSDEPLLQPKPFWRRCISMFYSILPESVRNIWVLSSGYIRYGANLNCEILNFDRKGFVMLADRYFHDMWVKNRLQKNGPEFLHYWHARIMRKPRLAILLVDEPERIFKRKQELSIEDISCYQLNMEKALNKSNVRNVRIVVNGRSAEDLAREVTATLLSDIGPPLINLMRSNTQRKSCIGF